MSRATKWSPGITTTPWPHSQNLRTWLDLLAERGELARLDDPIDPDQEVAAVLEARDGQGAVLFDNVIGAVLPLVGNTVAGREHLALAVGCAVEELPHRIAGALASPRPCVRTDPAEAPVLAQQVDVAGLLEDLPLPKQHEHDAGRYITSALVVVRDPRSGQMNLSINRMQVCGPRELRVLVLPGRLRQVLSLSEARGEDLEVALVLGVDPLLVMASQSPAQTALSDLEVASALRSTPLPVVGLPGTDLDVPAEAEMVLYGHIRAGVRKPEGPFGEFPLTYGPQGPAPVLELASAWRRESPVAQTILSGGIEHFLVGGLPREARLLSALRDAGVRAHAVRLTESSSCRLHAVVSLNDATPATSRHTAMATFTAVPTVKLVITVNDDIDIFADDQVAWAVSTRFQADRDLFVVDGTRGSDLDPSAKDGVTAKMHLDATVSAKDHNRFARMRTAAAPERVGALLAALSTVAADGPDGTAPDS